MKLFYLDHSPFAARVRLAMLAKGLDIPLVPPPGGALTDTYRAYTPIGLVPALELDDGTVIAESQVIVDYLEDAFPDPPLRPAAARDRARAALLARVVDLYLAEPLKRLFEYTKTEREEPGGRTGTGGVTTDHNATTFETDRTAVRAALGFLDRYLGDFRDDGEAEEGPATRKSADTYALSGRLTTADCALVTMLFFADRARPLLDGPDPFAPETALGHYWQNIAGDPHVRKALADMTAAQARRSAQRAAGLAED